MDATVAGDMPIDNENFGPKNYELFFDHANIALKQEFLTDDDREAIEWAMAQCELGRAMLAQKDDLEVVRKGSWFLFTGAYFLGSRCSVCDSGAKYLEIQKRGGPRKRPGKRSRAMQVWQAFVRANLPELVRLNPDFSPKEIAEELRLDPCRPMGWTRRQTRFVSF